MFHLLSVVLSVFRIFLLFIVLGSCGGTVHGVGLSGSGIMPYTFKSGRAYVLLGQDSWTSTWSNFGGGYDQKTDKDLDDTAAREGFEETMGVFLKPKEKDPHPEKNESAGKEYFKKLFHDEYVVYRKRQKAIFFVKVPYVKASHFRRVFRRLERRKAKDIFLEKNAFAWVRLSRLKRAVENANPFIKISEKHTSWSERDYKKNNKLITLSDKFIVGLYINNDFGNQVFNIFSYIQGACDYCYRNKDSNIQEIPGSAKSN